MLQLNNLNVLDHKLNQQKKCIYKKIMMFDCIRSLWASMCVSHFLSLCYIIYLQHLPKIKLNKDAVAVIQRRKIQPIPK